MTRSYLAWALSFLDRHSGMIAAVGLIVAAIGLLLTARQLSLYRQELRNRATEEERLAWERILKILNQVAHFASAAHVSSARHSPWIAKVGYVPPEVVGAYGPAQASLLSYWQQLRIDVSLMPDEPLVRKIEAFLEQYGHDADARASKEFIDNLAPISQAVIKRAQRNFHTTKG